MMSHSLTATDVGTASTTDAEPEETHGLAA